MSIYDINGNKLAVSEQSAENIVKGDKLIDIAVYENTGYSGPNQEAFGSNVNLYEFIDVSASKTLYYKVPVRNRTLSVVIGFGCYDAEKNLLYRASDSDAVSNVSIADNYNLDGIGSDSVGEIYSISYNVVTFPDEVKYVRIAESAVNENYFTGEIFLIGRTPVRDLWQTWDDYVSIVAEPFAEAVDKRTHKTSAPVGVFIGDSLTNWGGGNDSSSGFLEVVHDKTGMITKNEGYSGAWWQADASQPYSAVARVDAIISDGRKYDLYCFLMGTNAGANTDTGETSADPSTMPGAIRYCMERLKSYDPTAQILVCLPPQRAEGNENQEKVNEVIAKICGEYAVPTLDVYHRSGIVPNTKIPDIGYLQDGLHLAEPGYSVLGNLLAAEIKYLLCL